MQKEIFQTKKKKLTCFFYFIYMGPRIVNRI